MKIIVPFDCDTFFTTEDISLLTLLKIEPSNVLDQVLSNWNKYTKGDASDAYEQTVDDMHDLIQSTMGETEIDQAETILDQNSNHLAEIVRMSALHLQPLLKEIPDELERSSWDEIDGERPHKFFRVLEIKTDCKVAILTSDTAYL